MRNKEHHKEYNKKWYQENKERTREHKKEYMRRYCQQQVENNKEYRKEYYQRNKERQKEYTRKWCEVNKEGMKLYRKTQYLKYTYDLTLEQVEEMLIKQNYRCAVCEEELNSKGVIDHSHITGKVRGILCNKCNLKLAGIEDPEFREKAIKYLNNNLE